MTHCLALDLSTHTGFCVFEHNDKRVRVIASGSKNFAQPNGAHKGRRFACYRNWLTDLLKRHEIEHIYYEQVYGHTGIQAAHVYGAFLYLMAVICDDMRIGMTGVAVKTIKKATTGYGNATKNDIIKEVSARYNLNPVDDNEADAIAIMTTVMEDMK